MVHPVKIYSAPTEDRTQTHRMVDEDSTTEPAMYT